MKAPLRTGGPRASTSALHVERGPTRDERWNSEGRRGLFPPQKAPPACVLSCLGSEGTQEIPNEQNKTV